MRLKPNKQPCDLFLLEEMIELEIYNQLLTEKANKENLIQIERVITLFSRITTSVQYRKTFKTMNNLVGSMNSKLDVIKTNKNEQERGMAVIEMLGFFMDIESIFNTIGKKLPSWTQQREEYISSIKQEEGNNDETTPREPTIGELIDQREIKELDRILQQDLRKSRTHQPLAVKLMKVFPNGSNILSAETEPYIINDIQTSTVPLLEGYLTALNPIINLISSIKKIVLSSKDNELINDLVGTV